ncbi:MAG: riboflavin synthase [Phycisphaerales bacterium]|nr:riboflavin synthase [Phycisphaerales bacterium]
MFAGIVEGIGRVAGVGQAPPPAATAPASAAPSATRLRIDLGPLADGLTHGASVAISGACLTVCDLAGPVVGFDVVPETLRLTNLGALRPGDRVNIERSLRAGAPIDGHFVQGHVDAVGELTHIDHTGDDYKLRISHPDAISAFIVRKGSIALDGVSLTIVDAEPRSFSVVIIPVTWRRTTLGTRRPGDRLNIETDVLARLVIARLDAIIRGGGATAGGSTGVSMEQLRAAGFTA